MALLCTPDVQHILSMIIAMFAINNDEKGGAYRMARWGVDADVRDRRRRKQRGSTKRPVDLA
jgi:hypothetical protein